MAREKADLSAWATWALAALAVAGSYYAYDAIAPVADLLRRQRGFTQEHIGLLNAIFSLPNIPLSLIAGVLIDRFGPAKSSFVLSGLCFVGAALTAWGEPFEVMALGRLIFGVGEETLLIAALACLARRFQGGPSALAMALMFSLARVGSYSADLSPSWAAPLYAMGWRAPLLLAAGLTGAGFIAGGLLYLLERKREGEAQASRAHDRFQWSDLKAFDASFWSILTLNVLFASVFFPFRSTFAIIYFQDAKGLSLDAAGLANSWVFFAAIFATPIFGALADRFGRRATLLVFGAALMPMTFFLLGATHAPIWISTALMGASFSVIPAVIWPSTAMLASPQRLGTAFGVINVLQSLGMFACNWAAGKLNDGFHAGAQNPAGYGPMMIMFGALSLVSLAATLGLWARERGPKGHGLQAPAQRL